MRVAVLTTTAILLGLGAAGPTAGAQTVPSAAEVVARYVEAIGGAEAVQRVTSVRQSGTMSIPAMGLSGHSEMLYALPNRTSSRVTIDGLGEIVAGTDGQVGWAINPMQGPRLLADQELATAREGADFVGQLLLLADRFASMEMEGAADFGGEKTWKVKMVSKATGTVTHRYFSVGTGLLRGAETISVTAMGSIASRTTLSDYRAFGDLKFPTHTESAVGPQTIVMTTTNIEFNALPVDAVVIPDAIKPMLRK